MMGALADADKPTQASVSAALQDFIHSHLNHSINISSIESGGGGDCLYASIAAGLERMREETIVSIPPALLFDGGRQDVISQLRRVSATAWAEQSDEDVVNYVILFFAVHDL